MDCFYLLRIVIRLFPSPLNYGPENLGTMGQIPGTLLAGIVLLNGLLSLFAAFWPRKAGFLAVVGIHFWTDILWHVIYGLYLIFQIWNNPAPGLSGRVIV